MRFPLRLAVVFSLIPFFFGCWIPEKFEAKVMVNKDGSYTYVYDGVLTFALALAAASKGQFSSKDEANLKQEAEKMKKLPEFKKAEYLGKGRYKVFFEKSGKAGEAYYFLSREFKIFSILPQKEGRIIVSGVVPKKEELQQLKSIGATIDGILSVSIPSGAKILKHNASSEPFFFGIFGDYKWQIKSINADPFIDIQLNP